MDKKIIATPIPPDQPQAPRSIVRITGVGLIVGVLAILVGSFWPVVGSWLVGGGIIMCIAAFLLLAPYWRPSLDVPKRDDAHKLYGGGSV